MTTLDTRAKLIFPEQVSTPDSFNILSDDLPTVDFVVSRTRDGVGMRLLVAKIP